MRITQAIVFLATVATPFCYKAGVVISIFGINFILAQAKFLWMSGEAPSYELLV